MTNILRRTGRDTGEARVQRKSHAGQCEDGHPQVKERGLRRNQPCWHLDLGLLVSGTERRYISVVQTTYSAMFCYGGPGKLV